MVLVLELAVVVGVVVAGRTVQSVLWNHQFDGVYFPEAPNESLLKCKLIVIE